MAMKKLLLASCLVLAGLVPAKADYIDNDGIKQLTSPKSIPQNRWPTPYLGTWCGNTNVKEWGTFHRSEGTCKEDVLIIEKNRYISVQSGLSSQCHYKSVKPPFERRAPNSTHTEGNIIVHIIADCKNDIKTWQDEIEFVIYKGRDLWVKEFLNCDPGVLECE
jgi:hypothetical protein